MRDSNHENIFLIIVFANLIRRPGRLKRITQIHSRLYFTGKIRLMTADTVSPIKPIYRLNHLKIPLIGIKQRPSETFQTAFAGFRLTLKSLFTLTAQIGSGSKQNVGGRVQRSFCRVLNHADDEADSNHLHGHIVIDTEQAARQRNQQQ